jgi:hypothetical protein
LSPILLGLPGRLSSFDLRELPDFMVMEAGELSKNAHSLKSNPIRVPAWCWRRAGACVNLPHGTANSVSSFGRPPSAPGIYDTV